MSAAFEAIDTRGYKATFDDCIKKATQFLTAL